MLSIPCGYVTPGGTGAAAYGEALARRLILILLGGGVVSVFAELLLLEAASSSSSSKCEYLELGREMTGIVVGWGIVPSATASTGLRSWNERRLLKLMYWSAMERKPPGIWSVMEVPGPAVGFPPGLDPYMPFKREAGVAGNEGPEGINPGGSWPSGKTMGIVAPVAGVLAAGSRELEFGAGAVGSGTGRSASAGLRKLEPELRASRELLDCGRDCRTSK